MNYKMFVIASLLCGLLVSCSPEQLPTAVPDTETPPPTAAATETALPPTTAATETAVPATETALPATETAVPEPTPTPTAVVIPSTPLSVAGPWLIVAHHSGIFATNPDGSGLTQLIPGPLLPLSSKQPTVALSPDNQWLAYATASTPDGRLPELHLYNLITHQDNSVTPLLSAETALPANSPDTICLDTEDTDAPEAAQCQATATIGDMAWSPNGRFLAFVGAQSGPTSDLYLYDTENGTINQLTSGPTQASLPSWSPDSQTIVHFGVTATFAVGNEWHENAWAVQVDGSNLQKIYERTIQDEPEVVVGWQDTKNILLYSNQLFCSFDLRAINITNGQATSIWPGFFAWHGVTIEPTSGNMLIYADGCSETEEEGMYFVPKGGTLQAIGQLTPARGELLFSSSLLGVFYFKQEDNSWGLVNTSDGSIVDGFLADGSSPDAYRALDYDLWAGGVGRAEPELQGIWVYDYAESAARPIVEGRVWHVTTDPTGTYTFFFTGNDPLTLNVTQYPKFVILSLPLTVDRVGETAVFWAAPQ